MENNRSSLTWHKAYNIYTGRTFPKMVAQISLILLAMFFCFKLFMLFFEFLDGDDPDSVHSLWINDMIATIFCGIITTIRICATYNKDVPGGKFFRTVKGGFDTFKKAHYSMAAESAAVAFIFCAVIGILSAAGFAPLSYGAASCVSIFIFVVLARAAGSFVSMTNNSVLRSVLVIITEYLICAMGIVSLILTDGKLGAVHIAAAAAAVVLTVLSEIAVVRNYRKKHWDN